MAEREHARLLPLGKTITDAVDFFVRHVETVSRSVPLSQAVQELVLGDLVGDILDRLRNDKTGESDSRIDGSSP